MAYEEQELSNEQGAPFLLYEFIRGGVAFRFCNGTFEIAHRGHVWEPATIAIDGITQSEDVHKNSVKVTFPRDNEFAIEFLKRPNFAQPITSLTIYRGHYPSTGAIESVVYWKGRVSTAVGSRSTITLVCEPLFTTLRVYGLRARYQKTCRHPLYGQGCNLVAANFAKNGVSDAYTGQTKFSLKNVSLQPDELVGGMLRIPDGTFFHVIEQESGFIHIATPAPTLCDLIDESGRVPVSVYPGCDHTLETCRTKFTNSPNFGGFPWIPVRNPFGGSIN